VSAADEPSKPRRTAEADFLDRLAELDRNLPISHKAETAGDAATGLAERRRSSATAPRDPRPLLDLFPPPEDMDEAPTEPITPPSDRRSDREAAPDIDQPLDTQDCQDIETSSPGWVASLVAALVLLVATGATAAAYLFRADIAAILAAWRESP
jgi:hypothetical protein